MHRRTFLAATGVALGAGALGTPGRAQSNPTVGLETVAEGFAAPVDVTAGDGTLFVADQTGVLYRVTESGPEAALDVRERMVELSGYEERGLLGATFHPDYPEDERLFLRYSAPLREGMPDSYSHTFVLSAVRAPGGEPAPDSEEVLLEIAEPQGNHNAGAVAFGPEGYLYVGVGDGGAANDEGNGHVADWYDANPGGNGQDTDSNLLGSVLRIDVDAGDPYAVPDDNPLVGESDYPEQYAWGFRNPWRFSFDGEDFLVADVGQGAFEEVSLVEKGGNYGWNVKEGTHCFGADSCPSETPDGEPLIDPVIEYPHGGEPVSGISVIGGHIYRGERLPALDGRYLFADWNAGGRLFVAEPSEEGLWETSVLETSAEFAHVLGFGRHGGESYVLTTESSTPTGESGALHRLVAADEGGNAGGGGADGDTGGGETTDSPGTPGFGVGAGLLALGAAGAAALRRSD